MRFGPEEIVTPYPPLEASDYPDPAPEVVAIAAVQGCDQSDHECKLSKLWIVAPNEPQKMADAENHLETSFDAPHANDLVVCAPGRYHVPLRRKGLDRYTIQIRIEHPEFAKSVMLRFFEKGKNTPCFAKTFDVTGAALDIPLDKSWPLAARQGAYRMMATLAPKENCKSVQHTRWIFVDDNAPTFGVELELIGDERYWKYNPKQDERESNVECWKEVVEPDLEKWQEKLEKYAEERGYEVELVWGDFESLHCYYIIVTYDDGWAFWAHYDCGTIEVNAHPVTCAQLGEYKERIDRDLFGSAAEVGLKPNRNRKEQNGAGHLHIGLFPAFHNNVRLGHDFLASLYNFSTMACGTFYLDFGQAPPWFAVADPAAVEKALASGLQSENTAGSLFEALSAKVFVQTFLKDYGSGVSARHYHAISLERFGDYGAPARNFNQAMWEYDQSIGLNSWSADGIREEGAKATMEIRCLAAQASFKEIYALMAMFEAKIDTLRLASAPTPLKPINPKILSEIYGEASAWRPSSEQYYDRNVVETSSKLAALVADLWQKLAVVELEEFFQGTGLDPGILAGYAMFP